MRVALGAFCIDAVTGRMPLVPRIDLRDERRKTGTG